jgi:hypothetical protein
VQDVLNAVLGLHFDDVRPREPKTPNQYLAPKAFLFAIFEMLLNQELT